MYLFNKGNKNNVFYGTFLGGYTGAQVRESASKSSSSSSNPSSNRSVKTTKKTTTTTPKTTTTTKKTTTSSTSNKSYGTALGGGSTVPKETLNRTTSSSNPSSNRRVGTPTTSKTTTTSKSSSSSTTRTTSKNNFLGGYTGAQVRESASSTKKTVVNPNFTATANVNTNIDGFDYLVNTKVGYLQYNGHNPGGRVDNNFKPGVSLQTFDLTSDATNRGKNVTPTAIQNAEKASSSTPRYKPVGQGSGGTFMGGYTGADVRKDAGITTTKNNNESIFKKVGNFFKDTAKTIADKITGKDGTQTSKLNSTVVTNNQPEADVIMASAASGMRPKIDLEKARELERINTYQSITGRNYLTNYTEEDVDRLAALMFREAGGSFNHGSDEEWFAFLNTGAVAVNNAYDKGTGNTFSDKLCSLSNNVYQGLSSYATSDFDTVTKGASEAEKADLRKAAELVLSGQYTLPSNMHLQASESIVNNNGTSWNTHNVDHDYGYGNIHIGYDTGSTASNTDIYGNEVSTDANDYRELAVELRNVSDSIGEGSTGHRDTKFPDITNSNNRANV